MIHQSSVSNVFPLPSPGILHNFLSERNAQTESVATKIAVLLKDEQSTVRVKAAQALGYFYGDI